ncbi:ankyrin repeat-containing protein NPR4-like, partial [Fagus crenata]
MDPKLYKAAMTGDLHFLESLNEDDNSNFLCQVTPKKNTVLHVAAEFNQSEFVQAVTLWCPLLFHEANSNGDTPLHVAARVGYSEIVHIFISQAQTLHVDVESGQVERHKELLRKVNEDKETALHCATRNGHYLSVKLLIEADPEFSNFINDAQEPLLYLAAARGFYDIAELILNASPSSSSHVGPNGTTAFHAATYNRNQDFMKIILKTRPNIIREQDNLGWTPLHYAAYWGFAELVRLFLDHDSFVAYVLDNDGESALHIAARIGQINAIEEMIKCCPDVCDLTDNKGQTALHAAVLGRQEKVVKYILETPGLKGLINKPDKDGNTPLHLSAISKNYKIIDILAMDERVDIKATNKKYLRAVTLFPRHQESGFKAAKARYLLKHHGIQGVQLLINTGFKVKQPPVEEMLIGSVNTKSMDNGEKLNFEKRSALEINMLVAMLVATVTFTAAFTMP